MSGSFIDPSTVNMIDAALLAEFLESMSDNELRDYEEECRLAAYGRPLRMPDGNAVRFRGTSGVIPWAIGDIIRSHRLHGTSLSDCLEKVAADVAEVMTKVEVSELEAAWELEL